MNAEIRKYKPADLGRLQQITTEAFDGVSIDRNIQTEYGMIGGVDWKTRKADHIRLDAERDADGIFVLEVDGTIAGYITTWCNQLGGIGNIPNLAVDSAYRGNGFGRRLIEQAIEHFRSQGMSHARIETLEQNPIGKDLYPSFGFKEVARQIHYCMDLSVEASESSDPSM